MSTKKLNSSEKIRKEFQKQFEKSPEEQIEHRAQMLSNIFLSEANKIIFLFSSLLPYYSCI